jgi:hypothetical protein
MSNPAILSLTQIETVQLLICFLEASLECESHAWDLDQRDAAESVIMDAYQQFQLGEPCE